MEKMKKTKEKPGKFANYFMNIFFICRASPPVWVLGPLCTIDTTGGISYSTAYTDMTDMRYVMVVLWTPQ